MREGIRGTRKKKTGRKEKTVRRPGRLGQGAKNRRTRKNLNMGKGGKKGISKALGAIKRPRFSLSL